MRRFKGGDRVLVKGKWLGTVKEVRLGIVGNDVYGYIVQLDEGRLLLVHPKEIEYEPSKLTDVLE